MRRPDPTRRLLVPALVLAAAAASAPAGAESLRADLLEPKTIKLDGVPKEWAAGMVSLSTVVRGKPRKPDLDARGVIAYDAGNVLVGADVVDDHLKAGTDRVVLAIGFPGGSAYEVEIYPGEPGKSAGSVKMDGRPVAGAKVVEAPRDGGYTLEASIPWTAFAAARSVRVGLRGALFVHDGDDGPVDAVVGTAASSAYASLPALSTEAEQALADGLLRDKGLRAAPLHNLIADVAGDSMKERVLVFDRWLVVLGSSFRSGAEYYFADLGVDPSAGMLPAVQLKDLTGDGRAEIITRKRFGSGGRFREMIQVSSFGAGDTPNVIFQHEVGLTTEVGSVANEVVFVPDGAKAAIRVETGAAKGFHAGNYHEATENGFDPLLLPWGSIKSQTYKLSGATYAKASEEKQEPTAAPPPPRSKEPASPKRAAPSAAELAEKVYDQYKKDRGITARARFDVAADVAGDRQPERVMLHDREIVVLGKGYKGGTGYDYLALPQFATASDVTELVARDVTGDGKAEVVVRGVLHAAAPPDQGGTVDRDIVLVFHVGDHGIKRIFAAEVARGMGTKRIEGAVAFGGGEIELRPGKAMEWTEKTYPFNADTGPVGGYEPLLLPWGGAKPVRYKWGGSAFER